MSDSMTNLLLIESTDGRILLLEDEGLALPSV